jgi:hypothetical protein
MMRLAVWQSPVAKPLTPELEAKAAAKGTPEVLEAKGAPPHTAWAVVQPTAEEARPSPEPTGPRRHRFRMLTRRHPDYGSEEWTCFVGFGRPNSLSLSQPSRANGMIVTPPVGSFAIPSEMTDPPTTTA